MSVGVTSSDIPTPSVVNPRAADSAALRSRCLFRGRVSADRSKRAATRVLLDVQAGAPQVAGHQSEVNVSFALVYAR